MDNNEVQEVQTTEVTGVTKLKKDPKIVICAVAIIVLLVGLFLGNKYLNNPKMVFLNSINKGYKEAENFLDNIIKDNNIYNLVNKGNYEVEEKLNFDIDIDDSLLNENTKAIIDELNNYDFSVKAGLDRKNKEMLSNIEMLSGKDSLLDIGMYAKDEKIYVELKNLLDKMIEIPVDDYNSLFSTADQNLDDVKYLTSTIKDSILNNLEEKDFKSSKQKIIVNTKKIDTKKISYVLNEEKFNKLSKKVITDLKNDEKFINKISELFSVSESKIKSSLEDAIEEIDDNIEEEAFDEEAEIIFSVYTKGFNNEVVRYQIDLKDEETDITISYTKDSKNKELNVVSDEMDVLTIQSKEESSKKITTSLEVASLAKLTIDTTKESDKVTNKFELNIVGNEKIKLNGTISSQLKEVKKDKEYVEKVSYDMSLKASNVEMMNIKIDLDGKIKSVGKLNIPSTEDSVEYTDLSQEDYNNLMINLSKNEKLMKLIEKISSVSSKKTSYDDQYSLNY